MRDRRSDLSPLARRWIAGFVVVLVTAVFVSASIDNAHEGDWWGLSLWQIGLLPLAGFVAGWVVRYWEAALLALLPIAVAIPFGAHDQDPFGFYYNDTPVVLYMVPIGLLCAVSIVAGTVAALMVPRRRRRGSPVASS